MNYTKTAVLTVCVLVLTLSDAGAFRGKGSPGHDYRQGEVLVKYREGTPEGGRDGSRRLVRAWKVRKYSHVAVEKLSIGAGLSAVEAVELLSRDPNVVYVGLNERVEYLDAPRVEPNDPGYTSGNQWYLDAPLLAGSHVGTSESVFIDIDIDAPEAWAVMGAAFTSTMVASVGVIDSGCGESGVFNPLTGYQPNHEDLANSSLWLNPVELADPGVDSPGDPNTFIDDVNGWDFQGADNSMADEFDSAAPYHGTRISGIIAGQWDNNTGVAGIGRGQLKVLPLRASFESEIIAAINYAISTSGTPQARVLNGSWKFSSPKPLLRAAIEDAGAAGIAFVAAAGNDGNNNDIATGSDSVYPAQYTDVLDNLLTAAATNEDGRLAWFSNYGPQSVQIAAPGANMYSMSGGSNGYGFVNGTSFSAPVAAAALALVMSANPSLSPAEAIDRIMDGGEFDTRLSGLIRSGKRLNLAGALAPFAPYSGSAPMDTLMPVSLYTDSVSSLYGSISNAISDSPSIAVMVTTSGGAWAVSPVSPGLANFNLEFDGMEAPVGTYDTGLWRVTGISPFSAQIQSGQSMFFTSLITGSTIDWRVNNAGIGTIDENGFFTALSYGTTQVVLTVDGQDMDNSGTILVIPRDLDGDGYPEDTDCNDSNRFINPGADEDCGDGIDNDCDLFIDDDDSECNNSGGSGGCGTTIPPADDEPMWPVLVVLGGMVLLLLRGRFNFKFQISNSK